MENIEFNKNNIIREFNNNDVGVESNIYEYDLNGESVLLKLFNNEINEKGLDKELLENKRKKLEIIKNSESLKNEVNILGNAFEDNNFVGYFMQKDPKYLKTASYFLKRKKKIEILRQLKEKIENCNKEGIFIGDFNENNILLNNDDNSIKLCDLDNFKVNSLDFDLPSVLVQNYRKNHSDDKNIDNYCFNLFTISFLERIYTPFIIRYLITNPLPRYLDNNKNRQLVKKLIIEKKDCENEYFIDNIK